MTKCSAEAVARVMINYLVDHDKPISNFLLQQMLHGAYIEYLKKTGKELFKDSFTDTKFGDIIIPVVTDVYKKYRIFVSGPIFLKQTEIEIPYSKKLFIQKYLQEQLW